MNIFNDNWKNTDIPNGIIISDPPYNVNYKYNSYKDNLIEKDYIELLSVFKRPSIIIHYPEPTINILPKILGKCDKIISWCYNSMNPRQHRLISYWGITPDLRKIKQPYKNLNDKRIIERIKNGSKGARLYDWWNINQVKNVSQEKLNHPCQLPEKLIYNIIGTLPDEYKNEIIIDPFMGTGTILKVAKDLKYNYFGIEIDENYFNISKKRLEI